MWIDLRLLKGISNTASGAKGPAPGKSFKKKIQNLYSPVTSFLIHCWKVTFKLKIRSDSDPFTSSTLTRSSSFQAMYQSPTYLVVRMWVYPHHTYPVIWPPGQWFLHVMCEYTLKVHTLSSGHLGSGFCLWRVSVPSPYIPCHPATWVAVSACDGPLRPARQSRCWSPCPNRRR